MSRPLIQSGALTDEDRAAIRLPNFVPEPLYTPILREHYEVKLPPVDEKIYTDGIFAPSNFDEFIGQEDTKTLLSIAIRAAKQERRDLPSILLYGGYGLGKTVLAKLIAKEFNKPVKLVDGTSVNKNLPTKGLYIIDEIHNVKPKICDTLNLLMDKGDIQIIGCTTNSGDLPAAFRSRFRPFFLQIYTEEELAIIGQNVTKRKGVDIAPRLMAQIAKRSRYNARQITIYLATIFDVLSLKHKKTLTEPILHEVFELLSVDDMGLVDRDRLYLGCLFDERPVGLITLSAQTGLDRETIELEVEPYLLQIGMIEKTGQGRKLL